jgi:F0F1-type ATP synthase assembly protein I
MADAPSDGGHTGEKTPDGPPGTRPEPSSGVSSLGAAGKYAGLGLQFALSIVLFLYVGQWVDKKLGLDGPFLLIGVFVGAGAAFYSMYRLLMADQRRDEAEKAEKLNKKKQEAGQ